MFNVLEDRVIRFKRVDGSVNEGSLPEVYAALMRDGVLAFPALRPAPKTCMACLSGATRRNGDAPRRVERAVR